MKLNEMESVIKYNDYNGNKLTIKFSNDDTIDKMVDVFKTLLTHMGYQPSNISEIFNEE